MNTIKESLLSTTRVDRKYEFFYNLCKKESQLASLEELFSDSSMTSELKIDILSIGLLGALENNIVDNISFIAGYIMKNDVLLEVPADNTNPYLPKNIERKNTQNLEIMFNAATTFNNLTLAKHLTQKYSILENSITNDMGEYISLRTGAHSDSVSITEDGSLSFSSMMGGRVADIINLKDKYALNPILFNLKNFNPQLLDTFLSSEHNLHPSVVKHGLVRSLYLNDSESTLYLFANKKCSDIIKNSDEIKAFINSDKDFSEQKRAVRIALSMVSLKDELPVNNTNSSSKPKI